MSKFQIITIAIFVICIMAGVALFATYKNDRSDTTLPAITVWGTFPSDIIGTLTREINNTSAVQISINYIEKSENTFDQEFIEALARGAGPDAILIPQSMILRHADKLTPISYDILTQRDFKNAYIKQAELYFTPAGTIALPFTIDPLVMYWNRDLFTNANIAEPPVYWNEFSNIINKIGVKDGNSNIRRSAIAMGEFANITHAREILGALMLQVGNPITSMKDGLFNSTLGEGQYSGTQLTSTALEFYTQFSDPRNAQYSWNRSLPSSKSWFLSGSLATYIGFASEIFDIQQKNPNLDFDIAPLPQIKGVDNIATYGSMYGLSIVKSSVNQNTTYTILRMLTDPSSLSLLNNISYLPPVRRDMLAAGTKDPYQAIFFKSALISKSWLDMNPMKTGQIFQKMTESITSGKSTLYNAIQTANGELDLSLRGTVSINNSSIIQTQKTLLASIISSITNVAALDYSGFVKCDGVLTPGEEGRKTVCDFSALMKTIIGLINWLFIIAIPIATVLFAYAGLLYMTGVSGNRVKANKIFTSVAIGFSIMLVAWISVRTVVDKFTDKDSGATTFIK